MEFSDINELNAFIEITRPSIKKLFPQTNKQYIEYVTNFPLDNIIIPSPLYNERRRRRLSLVFEEQFEEEKEFSDDNLKSESKEQNNINTKEALRKVLN